MRKFYSLFVILLVLLSARSTAQTIYDTCRADFEKVAGSTNGLATGFVAVPFDSTGKKPEQICWNFGDNRDTCIQYDPTIGSNYFVPHTYYHTGVYYVCVKILYQGGCQAYKCKYIQIGDADSCSIKYETVNSTANILGKYFIAYPWDALGKRPLVICWDFGDAHDTCIQYSTVLDRYAAFHSYAHSGSYNVCVKVQFDGGCESHYCNYVQVGESPDSCSADFETIPNTNALLGRHFSAIPWNSHNKKPVKICWNFGDQHDTCVQYSTSFTGPYDVNHTYAQPGSYEVCVGIVYDGGCEAKKCKVIQVGERDSCSASFEAVTTNPASLRMNFIAKPWNNHDKKPVLICWNFGDNHDTCIQYATSYTGTYATFHYYDHTGIYNVCVKISYDGGCQAYYCHEVQVGERDSCSVSFEIITQTNNALGKYFLPKLWNSNNRKPLSICWNFGDNRDTCIKYSTSYTGGYAVFHRYDHIGNYNVCVKVSYDGGCQAYYCHEVVVGERDSCSANFEVLSTASNSLRKYFIAKPWNSHDKKPLSICWNFGDNRDTCVQYSSTYTGTYAVGHTYLHSGAYNVCVRIQYDGGCVSYYCRAVHVGEPDSCSVAFNVVSADNPLRKYFIPKPWNNHDKKPLTICWNFGDNHDTCIQYQTTYTGGYAVSHSYLHGGTYNVCVKIQFDGGCTSYYCQEVKVDEPDICKADFERIPALTGSAINLVYYRALPWNNHERKPSKICWIFGDGRDTCISYPENYTGSYIVGHRYDHSGTYQVCVVINYFGGCEAKECKILNIQVSNSECRIHLYQIVPSVTSLTRRFYFASGNDSRPVRVCWNFGDGTDTCISVDPTSTDILRSIKHEYPGPGVYRACVKVLFANGCTASDCVEVSIRSFTDLCGGYYTDSLINANTYAFKGFSIHKPNDAVLGFTWTFGDGSSGSGQTVTHAYNAAGVYRVCLFIKTQNGCETKICNDVRVAGEHEARLQLSPNPVINTLHALFYSTHNETVKIKIINASGVVVKEYSRDAVVGSNMWEFDLSGLISGAYSFVVQSPNQFVSGIFFKF
jgi:PKD repeat protein